MQSSSFLIADADINHNLVIRNMKSKSNCRKRNLEQWRNIPSVIISFLQ